MLFGASAVWTQWSAPKSPPPAAALLKLEAVNKALNLTNRQAAMIAEIKASASSRISEMTPCLSCLSPREREAKLAEIRAKIQNQQKEAECALMAVLTDDQARRLNEIYLQSLGENAIQEPEVQQKLGLTDRQRNMIRSIVNVLTPEQRAAFDKMKGTAFDATEIRIAPPGPAGP
jgi:hypothetical protein